MRISDWSSDVCSSDLAWTALPARNGDGRLRPGCAGEDPSALPHPGAGNHLRWRAVAAAGAVRLVRAAGAAVGGRAAVHLHRYVRVGAGAAPPLRRPRTSAAPARRAADPDCRHAAVRSEEHTSELQSLMRISY